MNVAADSPHAPRKTTTLSNRTPHPMMFTSRFQLRNMINAQAAQILSGNGTPDSLSRLVALNSLMDQQSHHHHGLHQQSNWLDDNWLDDNCLDDNWLR